MDRAFRERLHFPMLFSSVPFLCNFLLVRGLPKREGRSVKGRALHPLLSINTHSLLQIKFSID